jgi:hypothetical protein
MNEERLATVSRRTALTKGGQILAAIAVVVGVMPAFARAAKEDFYYQEEPGEDGKKCTDCINFTPKSTGAYGKNSGDCALLEGDVCRNCYCQGWTDKNSTGAQRADT